MPEISIKPVTPKPLSDPQLQHQVKSRSYAALKMKKGKSLCVV